LIRIVWIEKSGGTLCTRAQQNFETTLSFLHNYFDSPIKLFLNLCTSIVKVLDILAKSLFLCSDILLLKNCIRMCVHLINNRRIKAHKWHDPKISAKYINFFFYQMCRVWRNTRLCGWDEFSWRSPKWWTVEILFECTQLVLYMLVHLNKQFKNPPSLKYHLQLLLKSISIPQRVSKDVH